MSLDNYATITCECASAICACQIVSIEKQDVTVKAYACETVNIIISGTIFTINRQQVIDEKDKQLRRLKTKMIIGGGLGSLALIGLILTSIGIIH